MSNFIAKFIAAFTAIILIWQSILSFPLSDNSIQNVILLIGDGMGFMSIEKTKSETGENLIFDSFSVKLKSKTASADNSVTDSAAGATALACGVKTNNACIGVYPDDIYAEKTYPMNLCEFAYSTGMLTGVITTDSTRGATPACFSSHTDNRGNSKKITAQQLAGNVDLIWGAATSSIKKATVEKAGFTYVYNTESMNALEPGTRSFGQFSGELWHSSASESTPTLAQMTTKAIDLLDDGSGFFLMVEGAHIDKNSHNNNGEGMKDALISFSDAVEAALDYAKKDGHTLVVVTADHETGGITLSGGEYVYTTTGHTGVDVPLFVYGSADFAKSGETAIENTEIPKRIVALLELDGFPATTKVK